MPPGSRKLTRFANDREEEDAEDYPFPLTLKQSKRGGGLSMSPVVPADADGTTVHVNGSATDGAADEGLALLASKVKSVGLGVADLSPGVIGS